MNKTELIAAVASNANLTKADSARAVEGFLSAVEHSLCQGEPVRLTGFGTFTAETKPACTRRNPATGGIVEIPSRREPKFKFGSPLKTAVRES